MRYIFCSNIPCYLEGTCLNIVMEYCDGGDLESKINPKKLLSEKQVSKHHGMSYYSWLLADFSHVGSTWNVVTTPSCSFQLWLVVSRWINHLLVLCLIFIHIQNMGQELRTRTVLSTTHQYTWDCFLSCSSHMLCGLELLCIMDPIHTVSLWNNRPAFSIIFINTL